MTLAINRNPRLQATPQSSELSVNKAMQIMKNRLRPNIPTNQPLIGSTIAFDTRYEVSTQVLSSLLAPRSPAMCGSATLAMLVSSTSMNAARDTTTAISQGLTPNFGDTPDKSATFSLELIGLPEGERRTCEETYPKTRRSAMLRFVQGGPLF
jgi:hypothetical protein